MATKKTELFSSNSVAAYPRVVPTNIQPKKFGLGTGSLAALQPVAKRQSDGLIVPFAAPAPAVDTITLTAATGGTFTITVNGLTTSALANNVSLANLKAALEALGNVHPGDVVVTGTPGTSYVLTWQPFPGRFSTENLVVSVNGAGLTGAGAAVNAVQTVAITGSLSAGGYRIRLIDKDGKEKVTALIAYNDNLAAVQTALDNATASNAIVAGGTVHTAMTLTFSGTDYAAKAQPKVEIMPDGLTGFTGSSVTDTAVGAPAGSGASAAVARTALTGVDATGAEELHGFIWPDAVTLDAADNVIGNVMMSGEIHFDDIPIVEGQYTSAQLQAALYQFARAKGFNIQGLVNF